MARLLRTAVTATLTLVSIFAIGAESAAPADVSAIVDVTVLPMTRHEAITHQTVLVEGDRIVAIGSSDTVRVPRNARRIEGAGRYLLPGLIDMHVHFQRRPTEGDAPHGRLPDYRESNDDLGVLFVANGVTSVRQMHGHPIGDELRVRSRADWLGPTIYSTGPITDGDPPDHPFARVVRTPMEAARAVTDDHKKGYVAVKVYNRLTLPVYEAIVTAAAAAKIDVVGHVPDEVGLARAIAVRQATIEHYDSFILSLQPGPYRAPPPDVSWRELREQANLSKLTAFADQLRREGIWTCPTVVATHFASAEYEQSAEMKYMRPAFRAALLQHWSPSLSSEEERAFALSVVKRLNERGAGLLLGTDSYLVVPGFSAIQELSYFVDAGLIPYEALQTGTINAARALHEQDEVGTIEVGKRADLLLLDGNPLMDISKMKSIAGVMLRGRWIPQSELQNRLEAISTAIGDQPKLDTR